MLGWFNRAGGEPSVSYFDDVQYVINFPGLDLDWSDGDMVLVTPINTGTACSWSEDSSSDIWVGCWDSLTSAYTRTRFTVAVLADQG